MEKEGINPKLAWGFLIVSIIVNIFIASISLKVGSIATNPPTDGTSAFVFRFLFIQFLPLLFLIMSIYFFTKRKILLDTL